MEKKCRTCKKIKDISEFYKNISMKSGRLLDCKDCISVIKKENEQKRKKKINRRCLDCGKLIDPRYDYCLSCSKKGDRHHLYGDILSDAHKDKISKALKGKYTGILSASYNREVSIETREKISKANSGNKSSYWNGGKPRCLICSKLLSSYRSKYCHEHYLRK